MKIEGKNVQPAKFLHCIGREPLTHFLLAGLALFAFFGLRDEQVDPESRTIIITGPLVERLAATWQQTWQRPPTAAELDGLIRDHIKEEVYAREAVRLGLDTDDAIIRRRLRSKMEFLAKSQVESAVPDDAILQAWLDKYPSKYAVDARISFDQIYLGEVDGSKLSPAKISDLLKRLNLGGEWRDSGRQISLPSTMEQAGASEIERTFGTEFSAALYAQPKRQWAGPVTSGFGVHLVRVRAIETKSKPALASVRMQVENDWRAATAARREAAAYQSLLDGYKIKIEKP